MKLKWTQARLCMAAVTVILMISFLAKLAATDALAQDTGWSTPVQLAPPKASHPIVAADSEGVLHLFYVEGFYETQTGEIGPEQQAIMYFSGDGTKWAEPVDIGVSPNSTSMAVQGIVIDKLGYLHLIWSDTQTLYHSTAHIRQANNARAWATTVIAQGHIPIADVAIDEENTLHLLLRPDEFTVNYTQSRDSGMQWSEPVVVTIVSDSQRYAVSDIRMALSSSDTIHVTWSLGAAEVSWMYWSVWYARSEDGGRTWTEGREIASPRFGGSDIAVDGQGGVHLVWGRNVGNADGRWHAWSADGGQTWSKSELLFRGLPHADGATGGYGFALDSAGVLHLANSFGTGDGTPSAYYEYWQGDRWSDPQFIIGEGVHFANLAVAKGNELHFFGMGDPVHWIWHSQKVTDASPVAAIPVPPVSKEMIPATATKPTEPAESRVFTSQQPSDFMVQPTQLAEPFTDAVPSQSNSLASALAVAFISSGLTVLLVVAIRLKSRRF